MEFLFICIQRLWLSRHSHHYEGLSESSSLLSCPQYAKNDLSQNRHSSLAIIPLLAKNMSDSGCASGLQRLWSNIIAHNPILEKTFLYLYFCSPMAT